MTPGIMTKAGGIRVDEGDDENDDSRNYDEGDG